MWVNNWLFIVRNNQTLLVDSTAVRRRDYIVGFIADDTIIEAAERWRAEGTPNKCPTFDITAFIENFLQRYSKRSLEIIIADHADEDLAFVTYNPNPVLHVDRELWREAKLGEPRGRFMLAHECCHIIFHSNDAKAFSDPSEQYVKSVIDQKRPEYHANLFADHFLVSDFHVKTYKTAEEIAARCDVEVSVAERRISGYGMKYLRSLESTGEYCPHCANQLFRRGVNTFCKANNCFYAVTV